MSMLIRGVVVAAGIAGAFIGGYSFNPSPVRSLPSLAAAERPTVVVPTPAKEAAAVPSRQENLKLANFINSQTLEAGVFGWFFKLF